MARGLTGIMWLATGILGLIADTDSLFIIGIILGNICLLSISGGQNGKLL